MVSHKAKVVRTLLQIRSPKCQVVAQQLHNEGTVLVRILRQRVQFCNGIIEGLLGKVAGTIRRVENFVVKYGKVECKTETNGVSWSKFRLGNVGGSFVGIVCLGGSILSLVANGKLCKVTVVISLPLETLASKQRDVHLVVKHL